MKRNFLPLNPSNDYSFGVLAIEDTRNKFTQHKEITTGSNRKRTKPSRVNSILHFSLQFLHFLFWDSVQLIVWILVRRVLQCKFLNFRFRISNFRLATFVFHWFTTPAPIRRLLASMWSNKHKFLTHPWVPSVVNSATKKFLCEPLRPLRLCGSCIPCIPYFLIS